ncbi:HAD hydrolase-like protein [Candidatus Woesearchaeota archaeon]|nr:HAD hydrolase-like protein [Candidatus Woesearchaeota archaeon]
MSEITHVCFDIGGVANVRMPREQVISRGKEYFPAQRYLEFALSAGEFHPNKDNRIFFQSLLEEWCGVAYQPILGLVDGLKKHGYHTSILSNNNEIMYNTPSADAIKKRVDVAISSHQIFVSKPHWDAFCVLLDKIKPETPKEVVFIDDREENIKAANSYGLQGSHFRSKQLGMDQAFEELLKSLKEKGVRI